MNNKFKKFQTDSSINQRVATPIRPQMPRDGYAGGRPCFEPGELPKGGYQSTWCFDGNHVDTKNSPTQGDGKKVY